MTSDIWVLTNINGEVDVYCVFISPMRSDTLVGPSLSEFSDVLETYKVTNYNHDATNSLEAWLCSKDASGVLAHHLSSHEEPCAGGLIDMSSDWP